MKADAPKLGQLIEGEGFRDAIHIAVISGRLKGSTFPGFETGICSDGEFSNAMPTIGVIDPFLPSTTQLKKGDHVWVLLKPNSINGLRHVWSHPDIPNEFNGEQNSTITKADVSDAEKWLREYAARVNSYIEDPNDAFKKLISEAKDGNVFFYGSDCHDSGDVDPDFFRHISEFLGQNLNRDSFEYSCSC